jgi:hypothetical protein
LLVVDLAGHAPAGGGRCDAMSEKFRTIAKLSLLGVALIATAALGVSRMRGVLVTGEEGLRVWFYDQSEKQFYAVPRDTIPPHEGIGGEAGDGVRAIVVVCRAEQSDASKRRIAYLETYTPELKRVLEDIRAARAAGAAQHAPLPTHDGEFLQENTLVRRPGEAEWHAAGSAAGQAIMAGWRNEACPDGQAPVVCVP